MPVDIKGKPYRTVAERTELFHKEHKGEVKSITTEILINDENIVLMKTTIKVGDNLYEGHAQEKYGEGFINKTSAIENCETSAIGRALSSAGFVGEEFASANEVQNAIHHQKNGVEVRPQPVNTKPNGVANVVDQAKKQLSNEEGIIIIKKPIDDLVIDFGKKHIDKKVSEVPVDSLIWALTKMDTKILDSRPALKTNMEEWVAFKTQS
tara:strand:- start:1315 stop:1941 length:627 start_codon:yes stop_codon:yes gene_type:complete